MELLKDPYLDQFFFTIYSSSIANIAWKYGLYIHTYADDTQLYVPFDLNDSNDEMSAR